jgi:hypothetical protein
MGFPEYKNLPFPSIRFARMEIEALQKDHVSRAPRGFFAFPNYFVLANLAIGHLE